MERTNLKAILPIFHPVRVEKAWGWEDVIINTEEFCSKILHFHNGAKFSSHFHLLKKEVWHVSYGSFLLIFIDTQNAKKHSLNLSKGDVVFVPPGLPHQLVALEESEIFETSTHYEDSDSYRVEPGDSQK